jgi:hypothetical protein
MSKKKTAESGQAKSGLDKWSPPRRLDERLFSGLALRLTHLKQFVKQREHEPDDYHWLSVATLDDGLRSLAEILAQVASGVTVGQLLESVIENLPASPMSQQIKKNWLDNLGRSDNEWLLRPCNKVATDFKKLGDVAWKLAEEFYSIKPFQKIEELEERIETLIEALDDKAKPPQVEAIGDYEFEYDGRKFKLPHLQARLLRALIKSRDRALKDKEYSADEAELQLAESIPVEVAIREVYGVDRLGEEELANKKQSLKQLRGQANTSLLKLNVLSKITSPKNGYLHLTDQTDG